MDLNDFSSVAVDPGQSGKYGTPANILDRLQQVESGGNSLAVNPTSKAMGAYQFTPDQVATMHKQGITFNPFDAAQARDAADQYIQQLVKANGGDYSKAIAQYGGFKTKDPSKYVSSVLGTPVAPPVSRTSLDDFTSSAIDNTPMPQAATGQPELQKPSAAGFVPSGSPLNPVKFAADAAGGVAETVANAALGTVGELGGGLAEVAGLATGSTDRAQQWRDWARRNIATVGGLYDPTPETQTGKAVQDAFEAGMRKVKEGAGWLGDKTLGATGSPLLATTVDVGTQAAAQAAIAATVGGAARVLGRGVPRGSQTVESAVDQGRGARPITVPAAGAATASSNPYPTLTGQLSVRGGDFPQIKLSQSSGDLAAGEQAVRSAVASKILGESGDRVRPGVVTGNEDTLRFEAALARAANPTPQGILLRDKFAQEQRALASFADGIVDSTGASATLRNDGMRGDLLNSALYGPESLLGYLSAIKRQIYDEAAQRQGPNPVALPTLDNMVSSPQLHSSLKIAGLPNMLPGVQELLQQFKTNGFENPVTGEPIAPNTVGAAMELHKALNSAWTPDNSAYIGRMKSAIVDDVARAGGADLYQRGNAIHAAERTLLEAPGLKKIFGEVDPNTGIAKGLSPEKILPSINNLPIDQYTHVYNVFSDMANGRVPGAPNLVLPPALQQAGAQSLREMAGSLVRDVQSAGADKAGVWNGNSVNKTLNAYSEKLGIVAPPDVIRDLHTLNVGGQIMPGMHSYEGAGQQLRRMDQAGLLEQHAPKIGAFMGGATRLPGAEVGGMMAGNKVAEILASKRQLKAAEQTDAAMEAAAKTGKSLKDMMK